MLLVALPTTILTTPPLHFFLRPQLTGLSEPDGIVQAYLACQIFKNHGG
jgi:hypothetical protein